QVFIVVLAALFIVVISLFIWQFYKSLSKRDLIELNLDQYNTAEHPVAEKIFSVILYFLENVVIMPLLIVLWFAALSVVILVISPESQIGHILFLSASLVSAIRILAYSNSELATELAKLFPFITLSVFLISPTGLAFLDINKQLSEIPFLFADVFYFLFAIFIIEVVLRLIYSIILTYKK
ncbi:MAG: hypothetical protein Q7R87_03270, partial [Nanoarchaeota archaeon]|nr:hypothetical protein [Nanoarchaeota archaeon]